MAEILIQEIYSVGASRVWEVLRDFGGIASWMPGLAGCESEGQGVGAVRSIEMGPTTIKERLEAFDDEGRSLSYSIVEGPMPVENYLAIIDVVEEEDGGSRVDWLAKFDLPQGLELSAIEPALRGAYGGALKALKAKLEA